MATLSNKHNPFYQAQAILSRRDHAESEIREKLARKGFSDEQIESAVVWLKENKLVNDAKFARVYSESILLSKPVGPKWISMKLKQRGVSSTIIETTVTEIFSTHPQSELVDKAAASWKRSHPSKAADKPALWRFLASRGFSSDVVSQYLSTV